VQGEVARAARQYVLCSALGSKCILCLYGEANLSMRTHLQNGDSPLLCRSVGMAAHENVSGKEKHFWGEVVCP